MSAVTRRGLLAGMVTAVMLNGCSYGRTGGRGETREPSGEVPFPEVEVASLDDAVECALQALEMRHGEPFHLYEVISDAYDAGPDSIGYELCLAPDASPERCCTALVGVEEGTLMLRNGVTSDYPQWLFKERAEAPFREAMAADPGVVGCAATLFYARLDARAWRADEYDEYMGEGGARDPRVDAVAVVDEGIALEEAVALAKRLQDSLWELGTSMRLSVVRRGEDPYRDYLYSTDTPKQKRASRGDPPTLEEVRRGVEDDFEHPYDPTDWDGEATPGDPGYLGGYPQVEWL